MDKSPDSIRFGIVDCNNLCYRVRYSMPNLHLGKKDTSVAYGFLRMILHLKYELDIDMFLFSWDSKRSIREIFYPKYKWKRKANKTEEDLQEDKKFFKLTEQIRTEILPDMGFRNVHMKTGYEADDLMVRSCYDAAFDIDDYFVFITEDQDLYQVIQGNKDVYHPKKKELITLDIFRDKYSISPSQWIDVKCIAGCTSDNVDGVPGVAETGALQFLTGELAKGGKKQRAIKQSMPLRLFNQSLVKLPLMGCPNVLLQKDNFNVKQFKRTCTRYGFKQFRNQIEEWKEVFCGKESIESRHI